MGTVGELFRKLACQGSLRRMQVVIPRKMVNAVLEMMNDSVTAGHIGIRRTLACTRLRLYWYKQRQFMELWCRGCTRCAVRGAGGSRKRWATLKKSVTGESFAWIGIDIFGPYNVSSSVTSTYWWCLIISPNGLRHIQ